MSIMSLLQSQAQSKSESSSSDASSLADSLMGELDTDGDGILSSEEINNAGDLTDKLLGADSDDDGSVTLDELVADISKNEQRPPMPPPSEEEDAESMATNIMDELDTNQDGVLSAEEIAAGGEKAQNILGADSDGDGQVTYDELVEDISEMQGQTSDSGTANTISSLTALALNTYESAANILESEDSYLSLAA